MAVLVITVIGPGGRSQKRFKGFTHVAIGRQPDCDIPLEDPGVSLHHAELTLGEAGWILRDLGSTHGTRADGQLVGDGHPLQPGTRIEVGPFHLVVEHLEPRPLAPAPYRAPGRRDRYHLVERLAVGGLAEVFRAEGRVAVKRLQPRYTADEGLVQMFLETGRIAARMSHPNICRVLDVGEAPFGPFVAMELIEGVDLRALLRAAAGPLDLSLAVFIIRELCSGLDHLHGLSDARGASLGLVHRGVEPGNVMVSRRGEVKLVGFSLLKARGRSRETQPGVIKGRFGYMAPETVMGERIDHRADLFAVGALLYVLVTGQGAFVGESDFATLERVRSAQVTPPRELNPRLPGAIEAVILQALQREPIARFQRASDLGRALQLALPQRHTPALCAAAVAALLGRA